MDGKFVGVFVICEEADRLAHELAAEHAMCVIESECLYADTEDRPRWIDLDTLPEGCEREKQYLEARKLLRHHPTQPNLVQIIEENDETQKTDIAG